MTLFRSQCVAPVLLAFLAGVARAQQTDLKAGIAPRTWRPVSRQALPATRRGPAPIGCSFSGTLPMGRTTGRSSIAVAPASPGSRRSSPRSRLVAVAGVEPHRVYRAALAGLEPGSLFDYRVRKGGEPVFAAEGRCAEVGRPAVSLRGLRRLRRGQRRAEAARLPGVPGPARSRRDSRRHRLRVRPDRDYRDKFWPVYNADEPSQSGVPLLRSTLFVAAPGNHDTETRDLERYPDALAYLPRSGISR